MAVKRAKKLAERLRTENIDILTRESNPATTVAELVKYLDSKQR